MKMSDNLSKYEVLIEQYLRSIQDRSAETSVRGFISVEKKNAFLEWPPDQFYKKPTHECNCAFFNTENVYF